MVRSATLVPLVALLVLGPEPVGGQELEGAMAGLRVGTTLRAWVQLEQGPPVVGRFQAASSTHLMLATLEGHVRIPVEHLTAVERKVGITPAKMAPGMAIGVVLGGLMMVAFHAGICECTLSTGQKLEDFAYGAFFPGFLPLGMGLGLLTGALAGTDWPVIWSRGRFLPDQADSLQDLPSSLLPDRHP